jgi:hypothetical protein
VASLAGCIAGAMQCASAIRQDWIETRQRASEGFFEDVGGDHQANFWSMAQRLVAALRERARMLERLLGD